MHMDRPGEFRVKIIASGLVLAALINVVLYIAFTDGSGMLIRGTRLVISLLLCFFLFRGVPWSRWFVGILCGLGAFLGVEAFVGVMGGQTALSAVIGIWLVILTVYYIWAATMLLLNREVAEFFDPDS